MRSFVFWFSFHFLDKFIQNSGGVVAENAALLISTSSVVGGGGSGIGLVPIIAASVVCLHAIGFFVGYIIPRKVLRFDARVSRTISIETGMQNSALAHAKVVSDLLSKNILSHSSNALILHVFLF